MDNTRPFDDFRALGVPDALSAVLEESGISTPFPIQAATIPDGLAGRDVCGKAPTGSGKTLAFGLVVLARLGTAAHASRRRPGALILAPTRELAAQIETTLEPLARALGRRVTSVYGGVGYNKQFSALRYGVDVLVACPGRLRDLIEQGVADLSAVSIVVVDEADRMADMGFLPEVRRLVDMTQPSRQTLLFSATLDGPVDKLVRDYQHDPVRHEVAPDGDEAGEIHHHFWRVERDDRITVTAEAIGARGPAIVFCRTKRGADRLSERLSKSGLLSAAIHGDRSQSQRERALAAFRDGHLDALVATDVAARGIHVDAVPLVVQFDLPADPIDYVHRAGRTGRAGADGIVVSLVGADTVGGAKEIQRHLGMKTGFSSPDVPSLVMVEGAGRSAMAAPPVRERKGPGAGGPSRGKRPSRGGSAGTRTRAEGGPASANGGNRGANGAPASGGFRRNGAAPSERSANGDTGGTRSGGRPGFRGKSATARSGSNPSGGAGGRRSARQRPR